MIFSAVTIIYYENKIMHENLTQLKAMPSINGIAYLPGMWAMPEFEAGLGWLLFKVLPSEDKRWEGLLPSVNFDD